MFIIQIKILDAIFFFNINNLVNYRIVSTLYPVFTTNNKLRPIFLKYYLNENNKFKQYSLLQKQGGSRTYMYLSKLKEFTMQIPSIEE
jgi:type I restriction enzyme S subunit